MNITFVIAMTDNIYDGLRKRFLIICPIGSGYF
jgi:hypothetical protein